MEKGCCHKCEEERPKVEGVDGHTINGFFWPTQDMIVCKICGNKRCPKATDHRNECTNSNEPGQVGSLY